MPEYYGDLFTAVEDVVKAAWPGVDIYHAVQIATIPFERIAEEGRLPVAVLDFDLVPSEEWGIDNGAEEGLVSIYRVQREDYNLRALVAELEGLRTVLVASGLSFGQLTPDTYPAVAFNLQLPPNAYFIGNSKPLISGAVVARVLVGETLDA